MKSLKNLNIILLSFVLLCITQMTFAQQDPENNCSDRPDRIPLKKRFEKMLDHFSAEAGLTQAQKEQMLKLQKEHFEAVKMKREQQRSEMEAMRIDFEKQMAGILNEEQMTKFKALKDDRKGKIMPKRFEGKKRRDCNKS